MSYYNAGDPNPYYAQGGYAPNESANTYDPNSMQFNQFSYNPGMPAEGFGAVPVDRTFSGTMFTPASAPTGREGQPASTSFDDEPPLLEELGINFDHIVQKTLAVLNPVKATPMEVVQDTDLAGPLVFCLVFGGLLLFAGKLHFGYIYGLGLLGCLAMYALLNFMSAAGVSVTCIMSTLGYCLLPMCALAALSVLLSLKGGFGVALTGGIVLWSSVSASKLFVTGLSMDHQQVLVAYPCALVYGVFALLTVF